MSQSQTLSSDLAYLRDLAEAGKTAPLIGGRFLVMWGALVTISYIGHFLIVSGVAGLPISALGVMWGVFLAAGLSGQFLLQRTMPDKPGEAAINNRVSALIWSASGFVLFAYFAGVVLRVVLTGEGYEGFIWSVPVILGLYGLSQFISGVFSASVPLKWAGRGAIFGAMVAGAMTGSNLIWLLGAAIAFATVFLPGLALLKSEPREIV